MPKSNPARNRDLYPLWQKGYTIKEASSLKHIPPSTVGYYFKKYKRYAKEGRPVVIPQATEESPRTQLDSYLSKYWIGSHAMEMIAGNPERAYYTLGVFKLLKDLGLELTPEELEAFQKEFQKAFQPSTGAPLEATTRKTTRTASQSNESARVATLPTMAMKHPETRKSDLVEIALREIAKNPQEFREFEEKLRRLYAERGRKTRR